MARPKGSKNIRSISELPTATLSPDERIVRLANIMIEYIVEDQKTGKRLLQQLSLSGGNYEPPTKK